MSATAASMSFGTHDVTVSRQKHGKVQERRPQPVACRTELWRIAAAGTFRQLVNATASI
jgi:hypothetical protein